MSERKIRELIKEEKLDGYVECSALVGGDKIEEVFQTSVRLSLLQLGVTDPDNLKSETERRKCTIF